MSAHSFDNTPRVSKPPTAVKKVKGATRLSRTRDVGFSSLPNGNALVQVTDTKTGQRIGAVISVTDLFDAVAMVAAREVTRG